ARKCLRKSGRFIEPLQTLSQPWQSRARHCGVPALEVPLDGFVKQSVVLPLEFLLEEVQALQNTGEALVMRVGSLKGPKFSKNSVRFLECRGRPEQKVLKCKLSRPDGI